MATCSTCKGDGFTQSSTLGDAPCEKCGGSGDETKPLLFEGRPCRTAAEVAHAGRSTERGVSAHAGHERVTCSECKRVIRQCRCMGPKAERTEVCDSCKLRVAAAEKATAPKPSVAPAGKTDESLSALTWADVRQIVHALLVAQDRLSYVLREGCAELHDRPRELVNKTLNRLSWLELVVHVRANDDTAPRIRRQLAGTRMLEKLLSPEALNEDPPSLVEVHRSLGLSVPGDKPIAEALFAAIVERVAALEKAVGEIADRASGLTKATRDELRAAVTPPDTATGLGRCLACGLLATFDRERVRSGAAAWILPAAPAPLHVEIDGWTCDVAHTCAAAGPAPHSKPGA